jgi:LysR family transcriptional regulator, benzoate and cis,cis-muconate-responsive activator of ben and cat genes
VRVELRHLRYFIAVAERLSFSRAVEHLHVTVPPLSRTIRELEDEMGAQLFVRDRRRVALTDAGRVLLLEAKALAAQVERIPRTVTLAQKGDAGFVRVGLGLHLAERLSPAFLAHTKAFTGIEIQCRDIFSALQNRALIEDEIDVGFLRPHVDPVHLVSEPLFEERFIVLVSKASPLAKRKALRAADLAKRPLFVHSRSVSSGLHDEILRLYERAGATPEIVQLPPPTPHGGVLRFLLASRDGVFIVPDEIESYPAPKSGMVAVALDEPSARVEVRMAWRKSETSSAVLTFLDSMRTFFRAQSSARSRSRSAQPPRAASSSCARAITRPISTKQ